MTACQSSVDLVKHLSALLVEECGVSDEDALCEEVATLVLRYQQLSAKRQAQEKERREARWVWALAEELALVCLAFYTN